MTFLGWARLLEFVGIRRFYSFVSSIGSDAMLDRKRAPKLTYLDLKEIRDNSRYFAWANLLRGGLYVPVILILQSYQAWWVIGSLIFLLIFHGLCIVLEIYRNLIANHWMSVYESQGPETLPQESPDKPKREPAATSLFFDPKPLESVELYVSIGVEAFRKIVVNYTNWTKYTKEERAAGKRVQYVQGDRQSLIKFDYDTRVGEVMHLAAWSFNVMPFIVFLVNGRFGWAAFVGLVLLLDSYLVMLQRYNRFRVLRLLARQMRDKTLTKKQPEAVEA